MVPDLSQISKFERIETIKENESPKEKDKFDIASALLPDKSGIKDSTFIVVKNHEERSRRTFYMPKIHNKSSILNLKKQLVTRKISKFSSSNNTLTAETMPNSPQPSVSPLNSPPSRNLNEMRSLDQKRMFLSSMTSKSPQPWNAKLTPLNPKSKLVTPYGTATVEVRERKRQRRIRSMND